MTPDEWAQRWGLPEQAIAELQEILVEPTRVVAVPAEGSEEAAQQLCRLEAPKLGMRLWRNNVGACRDENDRLIRYGLANESARMNKAIKSHDLIGITQHLVRPEDVGRVLGIFTSVEVKRPGWHYTGTEREVAQKAWANVVQTMGGRATFATGVQDLRGLI